MTHIFKSDLDRKEYREITLINGLRALLISDLEPSSKRARKRSAREHGGQRDSRKHSSSVDPDESMSESDPDGKDAGDKDASFSDINRRKRKKDKKRKYKKKHKHLKSGASTSAQSARKDGRDLVMSAAALCIGIGSFADPPDIPGLAHFLEHMVFMGSKKYRKENAFDDFISKHGGESNASTDTEMTTFYFDIPKRYFHKALDMFAHFFISPLFLQSSIDREIMAVDSERLDFLLSEFEEIAPCDSERFNQLLGTLANPGNPIGRFLCGSLKTLKTIPQEKNIDVYKQLREFYKKMYSAHYMTLAVQAPVTVSLCGNKIEARIKYSVSPCCEENFFPITKKRDMAPQESLDDLQDLVCSIFEDIPNNKVLSPSYEQFKEPFTQSNFHRFFQVVPVEDGHRLHIVWALPPLQQHFKAKPLEYMSVPITHEGPGSVLSYLRKRSWALSVEGGNEACGFDFNSVWSGFFVSVNLTNSGLEHVAEVIRVLFQYIQMLQKSGPVEWFFTEMKEIKDIAFWFKDETDPADNVEQISENMQLFPLEYYLTGHSLLFTYDPQLIEKCLSYLDPDQCCISLWSKNFENMDICTMVEPYFGTRYIVTDIPQEWKDSWRDLPPNPELFFPEPNQFIPQIFELVEEKSSSKLPVRVVDNKFCRMWHKKDNKYDLPKGFFKIHLMSPLVSDTVEHATLCDLCLYIIHQKLVESLYPATLAGYEFCMEASLTGVRIRADGFSHKLPVVVQCIIEHMTNFTVNQQMFDAVKAELKKSYYNEMIKPYDFAKMLRLAVIEPNYCPLPDRYLAVSSLTRGMLLDFYSHFTDSLFVEGLVIGNFTSEVAIKIAQLVQSKMCRKPLPPYQLLKKSLCKLPLGDLQCRVQGVNRQDTNSCVTSYYQKGPGTIRKCCLNELLMHRMEEPCFNYLRTELQLGYSVFCKHLTTNGILGYAVSVETQAKKFSMSQIEKHISEFMLDFKKTLNKMNKTQFHHLVESVITQKKGEDTQLGDEAGRYWHEILNRSYVFDRLDREIGILQTISLQELKQWYEKYLDSSRRHVSFQVQGAVEVPMESTGGEPHQSKLPRTGAAADENFLTLVVGGKNFIRDLQEFKQGLDLYPYSVITS